jgi:hypothetical protein
MSIWIRAVCTKGLGALSVEDLRRATANLDFLVMAESHGLEDEEGDAAQEALRFDGPAGELVDAQIHYRPGAAESAPIDIGRWRGKEAREEAEELLEGIADRDDDGARLIRDVLGRTVETIAFCLKQSHADGMGWPIAWHTAMWLAERGEGLVNAGDEWLEPATHKAL